LPRSASSKTRRRNERPEQGCAPSTGPLSDEEAAAWERTENRRQDRDAEDLETGGETHQPGDATFGPKGAVPQGWAGGGGGVAGRAAYNEFWWDRGNKIVGTKRTSLIVDPPNGRYPAMTPEGQKRADLIAAARTDTNLGRPHADSYEDRPLAERCILGFNSETLARPSRMVIVCVMSVPHISLTLSVMIVPSCGLVSVRPSRRRPPPARCLKWRKQATGDCSSTLPHEAGRWHVSGRSGGVEANTGSTRLHMN
jgi:hypothetical protein